MPVPEQNSGVVGGVVRIFFFIVLMANPLYSIVRLLYCHINNRVSTDITLKYCWHMGLPTPPKGQVVSMVYGGIYKIFI